MLPEETHNVEDTPNISQFIIYINLFRIINQLLPF